MDDTDVVSFGQMMSVNDNQDQLRFAHPRALAAADADVRVGHLGVIDASLKCVWSGLPGEQRSCRVCVPASVVVRAWHHEMRLNGVEEGFFHFSWGTGSWLGYGLSDGEVRGVYCPTHRAERESRTPPAPRERTRAGVAPLALLVPCRVP